MPNGYILYNGPSMLDGAPIVVIATGFAKQSDNAKTGDMIQTWILRSDIPPHHAVKSGEDASICGDCMHRPLNGGSCYVKTFQAPLSVYNAFKRGIYPTVTGFQALVDLGASLNIRLGAYGDPAAIPLNIWQGLTHLATSWTGYTHQWRANPALQAYCMASADSEAEAMVARAKGWRTFRVRGDLSEALSPQEFVCPASAEAGNKTDCASCRACMGTSAKARANPVIIVHGATAKRFALTRNQAA